MGTNLQHWGVAGREHNRDYFTMELLWQNHKIIIKILSGWLSSPFTPATKASEGDAINRMNIYLLHSFIETWTSAFSNKITTQMR